MKFQRLEAFEKHLKEPFPAHLSSIYVLVSPRESERKKILNSLIQLLEKDSDFQKFESIFEAIDHLNSASLFSGKMGALFEGVDLLQKKEIEFLEQYLSSPNPQGYLVLGSATSKNVTELYQKGKKEIIILDLSSEKPWEEKERIHKWIIQKIRSKKKEISSEGLQLLFDMFPVDRILIEQEIKKLLCFVGEKLEITREDIESICIPSIEFNLFQLAQQLVWGKLNTIPQLNDLPSLLTLVGQLRNQLEMGLKIVTLVERKVPHGEIGKAFPRVWPKVLDQAIRKAPLLGLEFFKRGLIDLFRLELHLKTGQGKPGILFSMFCAKHVSSQSS